LNGVLDQLLINVLEHKIVWRKGYKILFNSSRSKGEFMQKCLIF